MSHPSLHETTRKFQLILFWPGFIFSLRNINVIMLWNKVLLLSLVKSNRMSVCAFVWWTGIGQRRFYTNAILGQDNTTLPKEIVLRHTPPQNFLNFKWRVVPSCSPRGTFVNFDWLIHQFEFSIVQPKTFIYRRGNCVYHHWGCKPIYRSLSYPFRSLERKTIELLSHLKLYPDIGYI